MTNYLLIEIYNQKEKNSQFYYAQSINNKAFEKIQELKGEDGQVSIMQSESYNHDFLLKNTINPLEKALLINTVYN